MFLEGDMKTAVTLCIMALPSMIYAAMDGRSIVGSMCDSKKCKSLDLPVFMGIPSGVDSYDGTGTQRERQLQLLVNRKKDKLTKDVPFRSVKFAVQHSSHLADFVL